MRSGEAWSAVELDDLEAIDWRGSGITWRPVRRVLDTNIIGIAAFTAERSGELVIERHTEVDDGRGHQEVYIVLRGRARFVIDGIEVEAPSGTLLRVDPQARREAVALEAHTAVLALGGEATFEVSGSEWIERARPHIRTDPARAREIIDDLRRERPDDRAGEVGEALLAIGTGNERRARAIVAELCDGRPELREVLAKDPDLGALLPDQRS